MYHAIIYNTAQN